MNTHSTDRFDTGNLIKAKASLRRRIVGVPFPRVQRRTDRRFASNKSNQEFSQTLSIEEAIAQFIDANPAQLYRGGA